jgi:hypothetical protein
MASSNEPLIYRAEVLAILGALADLVVDVRGIRADLADDDDDGTEEEEE